MPKPRPFTEVPPKRTVAFRTLISQLPKRGGFCFVSQSYKYRPPFSSLDSCNLSTRHCTFEHSIHSATFFDLCHSLHLLLRYPSCFWQFLSTIPFYCFCIDPSSHPILLPRHFAFGSSHRRFIPCLIPIDHRINRPQAIACIVAATSLLYTYLIFVVSDPYPIVGSSLH